jgi:hypothetical protein
MNSKQLSLFVNNAPRKAYSADDVSKIKVRKIEQALQYRYIQPNDFNSKLWLVYDIDRQTCPDEITDDLGLPAPHYFVQNTHNQHAHVFYGLETPVHLNPDSSQAARRFAAAVDVGMTLALDADVGYGGLIAKNPTHAHWRVWSCAAERYELNDLSEYVDLSAFNDRRKNLPEIGLGRNCIVFDRLRKWAYRAIRQGWPEYNAWLRACVQRTEAYNSQLDNPMDYGEIKAIALSVARYTHRNFSQQGFSHWQAVQGAKGGRAKGRAYEDRRTQACILRSKGLSIRAIADELQCSKTSVQKWCTK